jgi:hypothetical protein
MPEYDDTVTSADDFVLPAVDESPVTETGVILAGLDAERLLAGLGLASLADDATLVTLLVDQVRHSGGGGELTIEELHEIGIRRWRAVRPALAAAGTSGSTSGSVRQSWDRALRVVATAELGEIGPATQAYLTACWLRHEAIDALTATSGQESVAAEPAARTREARHAVSEVAP